MQGPLPWKELAQQNYQIEKAYDKLTESIITEHIYYLSDKDITSDALTEILEQIQSNDAIRNKDYHVLTLKLYQNSIDSIGCQSLSRASFSMLHSLNLSTRNISLRQQHNRGFRVSLSLSVKVALAQRTQPKQKKSYTCWNQITEKGVKEIVTGHWTNIQRVWLDNNKIKSKGCYYLGRTPWLRLTSLSIAANEIDDDGCKFLIRAEWPHLQALLLSLSKKDIGQNHIGRKGCKQLIKNAWNSLNQLYLSHNPLGSLSCAVLIKGKYQKLQLLGLKQTGIELRGCEQLQKLAGLKLQYVYLYDNVVEHRGYKWLKNCQWEALCDHKYTDDNQWLI